MKKRTIIGSAVVAVIIAALVSGIAFFGPSKGQVTELEGVEVREYKGENLSSINDFRENSIRGPQYVDIENYQLNVTGLVERPASYTYDDVV